MDKTPRDPSSHSDLVRRLIHHLEAHTNGHTATQRKFLQTVLSINVIASRFDDYTAQHQERVAILALVTGRCLGLSAGSLTGVFLGALVHDLGKIAIPRELLNKPGRLSREESALIRTHVPIGCEIMQHIAPPWPLQSIIAQHHERLDGSGYPYGLTHESIEIEPRIVAVCDVFEALCDDRPYRNALGVQGALDELKRSSGKTLDADVVAALDSLARRNRASTDLFWEQVALEAFEALSSPAPAASYRRARAARHAIPAG